MPNKFTKKTLDIAQPLMTTYTHHAHLLSILGVHEETKPWIYSNYIQTYTDMDLINTAWSDCYFPLPFHLRPAEICPWIFNQKLGRDFIQDNWTDFKDAVIYFIDHDTYINAILNQYYIPNTPAFETTHFLHDVLIFGYDKEKKCVNIAEFDENYKYTTFEISFESINDAFSNYEKCDNMDYLWGKVLLYKFEPSCIYIFDFQNIINLVKAYLDGETTEYWKFYSDKNDHYKYMRVFGIQGYTQLIDYVTTCANEGKEVRHRLFYFLFDHKRMMTLRFKYLNEIGFNFNFINELLEIEKTSQIILNLILKYNMNNNKDIIKKIIGFIDTIKINEFKVLSEFLQIAEGLSNNEAKRRV